MHTLLVLLLGLWGIPNPGDPEAAPKSYVNSKITTKDNNSHILILKIQGYSFDTAGKFNHFPSLNLVQSIKSPSLIPLTIRR